MIIKPCTRTIYVQCEHYQLEHCEDLGINIVKRNIDFGLVKFKLNMPQFEMRKFRISVLNKGFYFLPYDGDQYYYSPLLSTYYNGKICLGDYCETEEEAVRTVFNTSFNFDVRSSVAQYSGTGMVFGILEHFKKWEESGSLSLIPCDKPDGT
jgi:hypothetical protein